MNFDFFRNALKIGFENNVTVYYKGYSDFRGDLW